MCLKRIITVLYLVIVLVYTVNTQVNTSPCPRLFVYEGKSSEPNRWYGIITLLSDTDLNGVWLRIIFDQPTLQLGNWFGEPVPRNGNREYLVRNSSFKLKAHTPQTVRFFVEYDPSKPIPRLTSFILNAQQQCPEESISKTTTEAPKLQTSGGFGSGTTRPVAVSIV